MRKAEGRFHLLPGYGVPSWLFRAMMAMVIPAAIVVQLRLAGLLFFEDHDRAVHPELRALRPRCQSALKPRGHAAALREGRTDGGRRAPHGDSVPKVGAKHVWILNLNSVRPHAIVHAKAEHRDRAAVGVARVRGIHETLRADDDGVVIQGDAQPKAAAVTGFGWGETCVLAERPLLVQIEDVGSASVFEVACGLARGADQEGVSVRVAHERDTEEGLLCRAVRRELLIKLPSPISRPAEGVDRAGVLGALHVPAVGPCNEPIAPCAARHEHGLPEEVVGRHLRKGKRTRALPPIIGLSLVCDDSPRRLNATVADGVPPRVILPLARARASVGAADHNVVVVYAHVHAKVEVLQRGTAWGDAQPLDHIPLVLLSRVLCEDVDGPGVAHLAVGLAKRSDDDRVTVHRYARAKVRVLHRRGCGKPGRQRPLRWMHCAIVPKETLRRLVNVHGAGAAHLADGLGACAGHQQVVLKDEARAEGVPRGGVRHLERRDLLQRGVVALPVVVECALLFQLTAQPCCVSPLLVRSRPQVLTDASSRDGVLRGRAKGRDQPFVYAYHLVGALHRMQDGGIIIEALGVFGARADLARQHDAVLVTRKLDEVAVPRLHW